MFVQHHPCAHHVTSAKCVTCTPNKKVGHGQICQIKENFKFHPAAAFATGLIASQLQDHLFGQASWAQHLPMVLDIRPALRCSSRLSGVGPGNLRSGNLRSSWKMGQPDRRTCRVGTWNCPKDLTKYLRRASNKGFLLVLDASGGQKPWNPWTAARNAATMVEMLPSQHSSFISCQVLHKIKKTSHPTVKRSTGKLSRSGGCRFHYTCAKPCCSGFTNCKTSNIHRVWTGITE